MSGVSTVQARCALDQRLDRVAAPPPRERRADPTAWDPPQRLGS